MRRSKQVRDQFRCMIREKLDGQANTRGLLPMPHNIGDRRRIIFEEWEEWKQRQLLHRESHPRYDDKFHKPSSETVLKVWELLDKFEFPGEAILPTHCKTFMDDKDKVQREFAAKNALIIVLYTFIITGFSHRRVTYLTVFNALCRGFSDQYLKIRNTADNVRDMLDVTVKRCRRDLLLAGVDPKKIWDAVVNWKDNPLFRIKETSTGNRVFKRVVFNNEQGFFARGRFFLIIKKDPKYSKEQPPGLKVLFADNNLPKNRPERRKVCAERPYNIVRLKKESKKLLKQQEAVILYMDTSRFNEDYEQACQNEKRALNGLKNFGIDGNIVNLSNDRSTQKKQRKKKYPPQTRWSERDKYLYYRSIEVGILKNRYETDKSTQIDLISENLFDKYSRHIERFKKWMEENSKVTERLCILQWLEASKLGADSKKLLISPEWMFFTVDRSMRDWRYKIRILLDEYDIAHLHQAVFKNVYKEVKNLTGFKEIHSGFFRLHTRRYQPTHFWPTYVSNKDRRESRIGEVEGRDVVFYPEQMLESYRQRWFKVKDSQETEPCDLVGFDISSSQMQIIAAFLDDNKLRKITMVSLDKPCFKEKMAEWAWQMNENNKLKLRAGSDAIPAYKDKRDKRLHELVKELLMRVSYGSNCSDVERDQRFHPKIYGPGWEKKNAKIFLKAFNEEYTGPKTFRMICRRAAAESYKHDPYQGLVFKDPFDHSEVRWNPVAREDYPVRSGGDSLWISLPRGFEPDKSGLQGKDVKNMVVATMAEKPNEAGDYPVDKDELINMAAPCLVHMLDAYYSSLVMSRLASKGVSAFVGIHDCWLVPKSQLKILKESMDWAAEEWYSGLGPIYKALLDHLGDDKKYKPLVEKAYKKWNKRQSEKWQSRWHGRWRPPFRSKRVGSEA